MEYTPTVAWIVLVAAFTVYTWTAAPATTWLDAPELATAAVTLSNAHPPGHAPASLVGRLVAFVPAGELAFRVNLASALAAALAAAAVAMASAKVWRMISSRGPAALVGAAAGLGFAFARATWEQATRAEVYALEAALVLLALAWLLDDDTRALLAAAVVLGLGLANHHFVTLVFMLPAVLALALRRAGLAAVGRACALGLLGMGAFLYLPLRAARDVLDWGDPDRWPAFVWTVSARAFQKALGAEALPPLSDRAGDVATALAFDGSLPVAALGLIGIYALVRARAFPAAVLLGGALLVGAAGRAALGFDPDNPDARGYLLPALGALFVLSAAGAALFARALPRAAAPIAALALLLPAVQLVRFAADVSQRGAGAAEAYGRALLEPLPPRTLLVTSYFETTFQLRGLQELLGERPDVAIVDRKLLEHPYAPAAVARRLPELASHIARNLQGPLSRPVLHELAPDLTGDPADFVITGELELPGEGRSDRHGAERVLAWTAYLETRFHCAGGRPKAARAAFARARVHAQATDEMLAELARACDLR